MTLAKRNRVKELWLGLPETWRTELASAFHTFVPIFFIAMAGFLQTASEITWTTDALLALAIATVSAGMRAVFKALSVYLFSRVLPDPK